MKIIKVKVAELTLDPKNARRHTPRNLEAITASLREFGQQKPIVIDGNNVVKAGNGTVQGAMALGWATVFAVRSELTGAALTAFALTDNKTSDLAEWDMPELAEQMKALAEAGELDLQALGWDEHDLAVLLQASWSPPEIAPKEERAKQGKPIQVTAAQRQTINRVIEEVRKEQGLDLTEGRCVEIMAEAYGA